MSYRLTYYQPESFEVPKPMKPRRYYQARCRLKRKLARANIQFDPALSDFELIQLVYLARKAGDI